MKTQLTSLRRFVISNLAAQPKVVLANDRAQQSTPSWIPELPRIKERLFVALNALLLSKKNDHLIKRYIQQAQQECVALMDLLPCVMAKSKNEQGCQLAIRDCLEEVLQYLLASQSYYFNWEAFAPAAVVYKAQHNIESEMNQLKASLKHQKVERQLQDLLFEAFFRFIHQARASYRQLHYMENLQRSLLKLFHEEKVGNFDEIVVDHLIYYGFNECAFVRYCKQRFIATLNKLYHAPAKYEQLCFFEKGLMAQQEKANFHFSSQRMCIKGQLLAMINAELNYFQKKDLFFEQKGNEPFRGELRGDPYRVKFNLSADGLAYLIRLLCETEVIDANPRTHLMNFMAKSFKTAGIGDKQLSPQSLGTKYKQVTQTTALGIKSLLCQMNKQLDADFGKG